MNYLWNLPFKYFGAVAVHVYLKSGQRKWHIKQDWIHAPVLAARRSGGPAGPRCWTGREGHPSWSSVVYSYVRQSSCSPAPALGINKVWRPSVELSFPDFNNNSGNKDYLSKYAIFFKTGTDRKAPSISILPWASSLQLHLRVGV